MATDKLLDNNVISVLVSDKDPRRPNVLARMKASAPSKILIPVIAMGEVESGMAKVESPSPGALAQRVEVRKFFARYPVLPFNSNTVPGYAMLRARLWHMYGKPKPSGRGHVQKLPEELCDPVTGLQLGIDERDLQIVSIAIEHGLILATLDRNSGMLRIEAAAAQLEAEGKLDHLEVEDWTKPPP